MDSKKLEKMRAAQGFIAALDQSGGSTPKALKLYGVEEDRYSNEAEMFDLIHEMRSRIIKSKSFTGDKVIAAILFEMTMDREIDGVPTADYLWNEKQIVSFLKVDKGLADLKDGVQLMKPFPELDALLKRGVKKNIFGTKMRSVIKEANKEGIKALVEQQFEWAKLIISNGLVPIIEPEVDINSPQKSECEAILKEELLANLKKLGKDELVMFKVTIPNTPNFYAELLEDERTVSVVALSGGYSRDHACEELAKNKGMIASFSRALSEGLNDAQSQDEFDSTLAKTIDQIYQASIK